MPCTRKKMRSPINTVDPRLADVWHLRDRPSDVWDQRATKYRHQSLFETIATRFKSYHPDSQAQICTLTGVVSGSVSGYVCVYYGKTVAICTGFTAICFMVANGLDYVKINWQKIARHFTSGIEWLSSAISQNIKLTCVFGVSFAMGLFLTVAIWWDYKEFTSSLQRSSIVPSPSVNYTHN